MAYRAAAIIFSAWIILGGSQQPASPQGKADQKTTNAAHTKAKPAQPKALPASPSTPSTTDTEADGVESHGKQNIQIVSAAPEKSVGLVERAVSVVGVLCTIALTGVGIYGIVIALRTLGEMQRQREELARQVQAAMLQVQTMGEQLTQMSEQTASLKEYVVETKKIAQSGKDSADAALKSAQALINAERPWVMIQVKELPGENAAKTNFQLSAFNYGSSPAHIVSCKGPIVEWLDDPDKELPISPVYEGTWDWDRRFLAPKDSVPLRDPIEPWSARLHYVTPRTMEGIPTLGKTHLVIYGLLEYTDGATDTIHKTAFCFRRKRDQWSDMGGHLIPCGPAIYNGYT